MDGNRAHGEGRPLNIKRGFFKGMAAGRKKKGLGEIGDANESKVHMMRASGKETFCPEPRKRGRPRRPYREKNVSRGRPRGRGSAHRQKKLGKKQGGAFRIPNLSSRRKSHRLARTDEKNRWDQKRSQNC